MSRPVLHGQSSNGASPTYRSWRSMRRRINNSRQIGYKNYGGRGIKITPEWDDFRNFLRDMGERPSDATLDRIDPNGDYEPSNCRWASPTDQARNKRDNLLLSYQGETLCAVEWAERLGIAPANLYKRIALGWTHEKAIATPIKLRPNSAVVS